MQVAATTDLATTDLAALAPARPVDTALAGFLTSQLNALAELDFLVVYPLDSPLDGLELLKVLGGDSAVRIPLRPTNRPLPPAIREELDRRGFLAVDPRTGLGEQHFRTPDAAGEAAATLFGEVYGHQPADRVEVRHGSHRPAKEAAEKLVELRAAIEPVLLEFTGEKITQDGDGDYLVRHEGLFVVVAPRSMPGAMPLVRVATVTNLGINTSPDVGTLLANLNFGLAFGRFALDTQHGSIWFDETLLGAQLTPESLRFAIELVAHTAAEWIDRFHQLFGGTTQAQAMATAEKPDAPRKPGQGGYL